MSDFDGPERASRRSWGPLLASPWFLAAVVWLAFFWQLGAVPLYDLDEGAFSEATREMLASGNFITPHMDGEPRYDKPILIYWLQAASVRWLGLTELALRLPSALAATLWLLALWLFVRQRLDATSASVAALTMALSLQVAVIGKAAVADALLNLFIALAFFDIYRWRLVPARSTLLRVYLWLGLGFLTKGPVALFFPVLVSFLYFASLRDLGSWWRALFAPLGWLVFVAVAGPWYLAILLDDGPGFFRSFFLDHNLGRYGGVKHGHSGFAGYYFAVLPLVLLPFSGWFLRLLPAARTLWDDPLDRYLLLWFVTVFAFFSFSDTKLPHYLVYGITPLFILMARYRDLLQSRWLAFLPPILFMLLLIALPDLLGVLGAGTDRLHERAMLSSGRELLDWTYRLATWSGLLALLGLMLLRGPAVWQRLVLAGVIQMLVVFGILVPRVFDVMQAPVREAGRIARVLDLPTVAYRTSMPSFSVYRRVVTPEVAAPRPGQLVFLRVDKLERLTKQLAPEVGAGGFTEIYRRGPVALVKLRGPSPAGGGPERPPMQPDD